MSKTINCKTCGNEIAKSAKVCPNCGAKNKKPLFKKPIFWIIICIFAVFIIACSGSDTTVEIDYSNPDYIVTVDELISEFKGNTVSAQEKYADKIIQVSGKISTISEYSVRLSGNDDENLFTNVVLSLKSGQEDVVMSIKKDMEITAIGKFEKTDLFDDIELKSAKISTSGIEITESESTEVTKETNEVMKVDIDDILEDYKENSVSADKKYKDKTLQLTGKIYSIEDGYIKLEGSDTWNWTYVYAYYGSSEDVTSIKKGQSLTVKGVCKGEGIFSDIEMKKCTIVK